MKPTFRRVFLLGVTVVGMLRAATDVRVDFTLATTDADGAAITQQRYYFVYRPDHLPKTASVPMLLVMDGGPATKFHRQADQSGFLVISCAWKGNSLGTVWNNNDPRETGFEDYDYVDAVINRVTQAENAQDTFICGLSKGGHEAYAYACVRPAKIRAVCSCDEFMGLTSNLPTAPLPVLAIHGTMDRNVPYTMHKDTVDAWRAMNGLTNVIPITTFEAAPLIPGRVTQTTWRRAGGGPQVAWVTIIGGDHRWPVPEVQTGFDSPAAVWAFFSQYLSATQSAPKIVWAPIATVQLSGQPASFRAVAAGDAPLHYQWQKNGADLVGATEAWYTTPFVTAADSGALFHCVISNAAGAATTPDAKLTVRAAPPGPVITGAPRSQAVIAGRPVNFSVTAAGSGRLTYQWQKNGCEIVGGTDATLSLPAAITADSGALFTVAVGDASGSALSPGATLAVTEARGAPEIQTNPGRNRLPVGATGTFAVEATSRTPMRYQWQKGISTGNMADIPGATAAHYTTPPATRADHATLFRCIVSNAAGNSTSASEMLLVSEARGTLPDRPGAVKK